MASLQTALGFSQLLEERDFSPARDQSRPPSRGLKKWSAFGITRVESIISAIDPTTCQDSRSARVFAQGYPRSGGNLATTQVWIAAAKCLKHLVITPRWVRFVIVPQ
jgi:hypothetical protein